MPPPRFLEVFDSNTQLVKTECEAEKNAPPPNERVVLFLKMQLSKVGEAPELPVAIPPPATSAELEINVQLLIIELDAALYMPPPLSFEPPFAFPAVIVKPSKTAVALVLPPLTT